MSDERRRARQMMAVQAGQLIRSKLGAIDTREAVEHIRIAALGSLAETRGLWEFLIAKGLATDAERENALDRGYRSLLAQVEGKAGEIYVAGQSGNA